MFNKANIVTNLKCFYLFVNILFNYNVLGRQSYYWLFRVNFVVIFVISKKDHKIMFAKRLHQMCRYKNKHTRPHHSLDRVSC